MAIKIPYLAIVNISTLVTSLALVAISALTIYWTREAIDYDFSTRDYWWYRGPENNPGLYHQVTLEYDFINENLIFASTGFTIAAGLAALIGYFSTRNVKPSPVKTSLVNFVPALAFTFSLVALIATSVRHARMAKTSCFWEKGYTAGEHFTCTRELGVCRILGYTKNRSSLGIPLVKDCMDLHRARTMLIPLTVVSALLLGLGVARLVFVGRKDKDAVAEERVQNLQRS